MERFEGRRNPEEEKISFWTIHYDKSFDKTYSGVRDMIRYDVIPFHDYNVDSN